MGAISSIKRIACIRECMLLRKCDIGINESAQHGVKLSMSVASLNIKTAMIHLKFCKWFILTLTTWLNISTEATRTIKSTNDHFFFEVYSRFWFTAKVSACARNKVLGTQRTLDLVWVLTYYYHVIPRIRLSIKIAKKSFEKNLDGSRFGREICLYVGLSVGFIILRDFELLQLFELIVG